MTPAQRGQVVGMALAGADLAAIAAAVGGSPEECREVLRANGVRVRSAANRVVETADPVAEIADPVDEIRLAGAPETAGAELQSPDGCRQGPAMQEDPGVFTGKPGWSDAEVVELRRLWDLKLSFSAIARGLPGRTRNAVIAKADRLGLDRLAESPIKRRAAPVPPPVLPTAAPAPRVCQWIEGLPSADDACKCGAPVERPGGAWCEAHRARVYTGRAGPVDPAIREERAKRGGGPGRVVAELLSNGGMR